MRFISVLSGVLVAVGPLAQAQEPPKAPWALDWQSTAAVSVPADIRRASGLDLDHGETDPIKGVAADLNGDGVNEYLLESARLCGSGGCVYVLFDGVTRRKVGQFFGNPLIVRAERVNGYPIIATYSHQSAESGEYTEYSFDRTVYVVTSARRVEGAAVDRLVEELRIVPIWRGRP